MRPHNHLSTSHLVQKAARSQKEYERQISTPEFNRDIDTGPDMEQISILPSSTGLKLFARFSRRVVSWHVELRVVLRKKTLAYYYHCAYCMCVCMHTYMSLVLLCGATSTNILTSILYSWACTRLRVTLLVSGR